MPTTVALYLRSAARLEIAAQSLYTELAGRFTSDPVLQRLFLRLADEEGQHALRIDLLARHQGGTLLPRGVLESALASLEEAAAGIGQLQRDLRAIPEPLDRAYLLRRLVEMENRVDAIHAESMTKLLDRDVRKLFASLAEQDGQHRELVKLALTRAVA